MRLRQVRAPGRPRRPRPWRSSGSPDRGLPYDFSFLLLNSYETPLAAGNRQLTARRLDVPPTREPNCRRDAGAVELGLERRDHRAGGSVVAAGRVVRDQVDLVRVPAEELGEESRVL